MIVEIIVAGDTGVNFAVFFSQIIIFVLFLYVVIFQF